jgi:uncharacterized iron-regulated membrane protein
VSAQKTQRHTLRQSMDWLHTWAGVVFSVLLFLVFFMGTLSVFDAEIDRWMMPQTRLSETTEFSFDAKVKPHLEALAPEAKQWFVGYPNERMPAVRIGWRDGGTFVSRFVDPGSGELLPEAGSWGGTGFFFPFHYMFHIKWMDVGYWLLAVVSIGMLVLLVSGVIIHKKIFTDLFTFRPNKSTHRATLDVHNICGVLILPFHFLITLSGLIIFIFVYFKPALPLVFGDDAPKATQEVFGQIKRPPLKVPGTLAPVDPMVEEAKLRWGGGNVRNLSIANPEDKNSVVQILRRPDDRVTYSTMNVGFDGVTGELIGEQKELGPVIGVQRFFSGLHMIPFSHWGIRWMYFLMGLGGCVLIASGLLLWVDKRQVRHAKEGRNGYRIVNAMACAGSVGVVVSTLAMLVANRVLPVMENRESTEAGVYFAVWILSLIHAAWRSGTTPMTRRAWFEQGWAVMALALIAVLLNAITTGDHLLRTLANGYWSVAGTDLVLLLTAGLAFIIVRRNVRKQAHATAQARTLDSAQPVESMS